MAHHSANQELCRLLAGNRVLHLLKLLAQRITLELCSQLDQLLGLGRLCTKRGKMDIQSQSAARFWHRHGKRTAPIKSSVAFSPGIVLSFRSDVDSTIGLVESTIPIVESTSDLKDAQELDAATTAQRNSDGK